MKEPKKGKRVFGRDLKVSIVNSILEGKENSQNAARNLGVPKELVQRWIEQFKADPNEAFKRSGGRNVSYDTLPKSERSLTLAPEAPSSKTVKIEELEKEIRELSAKNKELQIEVESLKKCVSIFAKNAG